MRILKKTLYNILYILSVLDFILAVTIFIPIKGVIGDFLRPLRSLFTTTLYYNCIVLIIVSVGTIIYVKINYIKVKDARAFFILHLIHFATLALGIVISCSVTYCNDFMQGITYECCYPGADKGDHSLISVDDCSEKYNVNQCDVFLDYKSPYRTTAVVYLNYKDPWEADDTPELFNTTHKDIIPGNNKNGGKSIKTFCNNEGYSYVSLNIEFSDSDNLVSFETKIRNCITSIKKDFGFKDMYLCGSGIAGLISLRCTVNSPVNGVIALYPSFDNSITDTQGYNTNFFTDISVPIFIAHGQIDSLYYASYSSNFVKLCGEYHRSIAYLEIPTTENAFDKNACIAWERTAKSICGFLRTCRRKARE